MKALTGLPTSAYLMVAEQVKVPLADLLKLVPALESGLLPAYVARYRPDLSAGLDTDRLHDVLQLLRSFLDLEDRRITILTAVGRKDALTPELRARIEAASERRALEDLYLPFRAKRPSAADQAFEQGLEPLASFLWDQEPPDGDIEGAAREYVNAEKGVADVRAALAGARYIVAQRLGDDGEVRAELRRIAFAHTELRVQGGESRRADAALRKKVEWLKGYRSPVNKVGWRQHLALRRGVRERLLRFELVLPENRVVSFMLKRLLRDRTSLFCSQLGAAAYIAYHEYLAPVLRNDVVHWLTDRADAEALRLFKKNLRKTLLAPPAGAVPTIGLETGKPGGWRAAVVGADGKLLAAAIVHGRQEAAPDPAAAAASQADQPETPEPKDESAPEEAPHSQETSAKGTSDAGDALETEQSNEKAAANAAESGSDEAASAEPAAPNGAEAGGEAADAAPLEAEAAKSMAARVKSSPEQAARRDVGAAQPAAPPDAPAAAGSESSGDMPAGEHSAAPGTPLPAEAPGNGTGSNQPRTKRDRVPDTPRGSLGDLIREHSVEALVVTNGRGARESEKVIRGALRQAGAPKMIRTTVNEAGSWIYATSKAARKELPEVEPAVRSAVSLARRLQDPLSELVKVDPKLLGIGQFYGEIEPGKLRGELRRTVEACVLEVGVDLNAASQELLGSLPGVTDRLAKRIVEHRNKEGDFSSREQLKKVPGMSGHLYRQAVGFARVKAGAKPLDATGVHPDWYAAAEKIVAAAGISMEEALGKPEALASVDLDELETAECPRPILEALVSELAGGKPDPRPKFQAHEPPVELLDAEKLKAGLEVEGLVMNVTDFGAFVDIGADQDGLVHLSHIADKFREKGQLTVKAGDRMRVRVLTVENDGDRISLTTRDRTETSRGPRGGGRPRPANGRRRPEGPRSRRKGPGREPRFEKRSYGPDRAAQAREAERLGKLSLDEKLSLLETKYRTKV